MEDGGGTNVTVEGKKPCSKQDPVNGLMNQCGTRGVVEFGNEETEGISEYWTGVEDVRGADKGFQLPYILNANGRSLLWTMIYMLMCSSAGHLEELAIHTVTQPYLPLMPPYVLYIDFTLTNIIVAVFDVALTHGKEHLYVNCKIIRYILNKHGNIASQSRHI